MPGRAPSAQGWLVVPGIVSIRKPPRVPSPDRLRAPAPPRGRRPVPGPGSTRGGGRRSARRSARGWARWGWSSCRAVPGPAPAMPGDAGGYCPQVRTSWRRRVTPVAASVLYVVAAYRLRGAPRPVERAVFTGLNEADDHALLWMCQHGAQPRARAAGMIRQSAWIVKRKPRPRQQFWQSAHQRHGVQIGHRPNTQIAR